MVCSMSQEKVADVLTDEKGPCHQHSCQYDATCLADLDRARCLCHFTCPRDVIEQVLSPTSRRLN